MQWEYSTLLHIIWPMCILSQSDITANFGITFIMIFIWDIEHSFSDEQSSFGLFYLLYFQVLRVNMKFERWKNVAQPAWAQPTNIIELLNFSRTSISNLARSETQTTNLSLKRTLLKWDHLKRFKTESRRFKMRDKRWIIQLLVGKNVE